MQFSFKRNIKVVSDLLFPVVKCGVAHVFLSPSFPGYCLIQTAGPAPLSEIRRWWIHPLPSPNGPGPIPTSLHNWSGGRRSVPLTHRAVLTYPLKMVLSERRRLKELNINHESLRVFTLSFSRTHLSGWFND